MSHPQVNVSYEGRELPFVLKPYGPGRFKKLAHEITNDGLKLATFEEVVALVAHAFRTGEGIDQVKETMTEFFDHRERLKKRVLSGFSATTHLPGFTAYELSVAYDGENLVPSLRPKDFLDKKVVDVLKKGGFRLVPNTLKGARVSQFDYDYDTYIRFLRDLKRDRPSRRKKGVVGQGLEEFDSQDWRNGGLIKAVDMSENGFLRTLFTDRTVENLCRIVEKSEVEGITFPIVTHERTNRYLTLEIDSDRGSLGQRVLGMGISSTETKYVHTFGLAS